MFSKLFICVVGHKIIFSKKTASEMSDEPKRLESIYLFPNLKKKYLIEEIKEAWIHVLSSETKGRKKVLFLLNNKCIA